MIKKSNFAGAAAALALVSFCLSPVRAEQAPVPEAESVQDTKKEGKPMVKIETSRGTITAELWPDKAPETVANFLSYVEKSFYDNLIFHRVISGFMIQGGGFSADMQQKKPGAPVKNEAKSDVQNVRGTLAMARTSDVNSATSQFFINLVDNHFLNHRGTAPQLFGYCVFGKVTDGMDVVDAIGSVATGTSGHFQDVPREPVLIQSITVVD